MQDKEKAAEKALAELLDKSMQAGDFLVEQAPLVVQELLAYKAFEHAAYALLLLLVSAFLFWAVINRINVYRNDADPDAAGAAMLASLPAVTFFCFFFGDLLSFIKITVSPRVYLLEYAVTLVKWFATLFAASLFQASLKYTIYNHSAILILACGLVASKGLGVTASHPTNSRSL